MGRRINSGAVHGTGGSPQTTLEQSQLEQEMTEAEQKLIQEENEKLFAELDRNNVKYTKENIIFISRDQTGQIVFLETGNIGAGCKHILKRHAKNFKDTFNLETDQIPTFLKQVVRYGQVISNEIVIKNGKEGFERKYYYQGKFIIITGIGLNGFMVSAYPRKIK